MNDASIRNYQKALVEQLKHAYNFKTPLVEEVFMNVPRHLFLPDEPLENVYSDVSIAVKRGDDGRWTSSSSMPAIMAIMLDQLDLQPGQRVLEIGTGTGFNAALIGFIVGPTGKVVTVDIQPDLVDDARKHLDAAGYDWVQTVVGDGGYGYLEEAPYDRIILTAASDVISPSWREQLIAGGILVVPFDIVGPQHSIAFKKQNQELVSVDITACGFMALQGAFTLAPRVRTALGPDPRLFLLSEHDRKLPVEAETIGAWLSHRGKDSATGVTVTKYELEYGLIPWLGIHDSGVEQRTDVKAMLCAMGDLADQNIIPPMAGDGAARKGMHSVVIIKSDGMAALMRPPGQKVPLDDPFHPVDDIPFELYVRNFGPDASVSQDTLEYIKNWDQAGKPTSLQWHVRAIPAETDYQPLDGEFLVKKPWMNLIVRYQ